MKKSLSVVLAVILIMATVLCSCKSEEKSYGVLKVDGEEIKVSSFVKINGKDVSYDLFRYCYLTQKALMEEDNANIDWSKKENQDELMQSALSEIKFFSSIEILCEKYGIRATEEMYSDVDNTMKQVYDNVKSAEKYRKLLSENYLTPELYEEILILDTLYTHMEEKLVGTDKDKNKVTFTESEALESYMKNHIRLASIYFPVQTTDESGVPVSEEEYESNKKEAKNLVNSAVNKLKSKSFESVMAEYLSEESVEASINSYYEIDYINELLNIDITELKIGEVSEPIFAQQSYFLVQPLETDEEYIKNNNMDAVNEYYIGEKFSQISEEIVKEIKIEELEHFDKINTTTLV